MLCCFVRKAQILTPISITADTLLLGTQTKLIQYFLAAFLQTWMLMMYHLQDIDVLSSLGDLTAVAQSKHARLPSAAGLPMGRAVALCFILLILWKATL